MNRKLIETFLWAAQLGSFRAAAEQLHSTQPAVSMRIRQLEDELGVQLFERGARASRLTAKGRDLVHYAEALLDMMNEVQVRVADPRALGGELRLGVAELVASTWLPQFVAALGQRFPELTLRIEVELTNALLRRLRTRDLDLAFLIGPLAEPHLKSVSLGEVEIGWLASPRLKLPAGPLHPRDLERVPIISLSEDSALHVLAIQWFRENRALYRRANLCNSMHAVSILLQAGLGISLLPIRPYQPLIDSGELLYLDTTLPLPPVEYVAAYYATRTQPLIAEVVAVAEATTSFGREGPRAPAGRDAAKPPARRRRANRG